MNHTVIPLTDPQKAARKLFHVVGLIQGLEQRCTESRKFIFFDRDHAINRLTPQTKAE